MTIGYLKELIKNLPDDMRICADDGSKGMFSDNSEFVTLIYTKENKNNICVLQTKNDFDLQKELQSMLNNAIDDYLFDEQGFWIDFNDMGYKYTDFEDEERQEWAKEQLENYGLI